VNVFLHCGEPAAKIVANGRQSCRAGTFEVFLDNIMRRPSSYCGVQVMLKLPVLAAEVLDAHGFAHELLQMFFALGSMLPQQTAAALGHRGHRRLTLVPQTPQLPQAAANNVPPRYAGFLPREPFGKFPHLVQRMPGLNIHTAIGHELGHAAVEHVALAAALGQFVVQQSHPRLHVLNPHS
jgi:hypothetical protein